MSNPANTFQRLPEVKEFTEAIQEANTATAKLRELQELKTEIESFESRIRDADTEAKALKIASELSIKRELNTVLSLRHPVYAQDAAEAWEKARKAAYRAADAMASEGKRILDPAVAGLEGILSTVISPQYEEDVKNADQYTYRAISGRRNDGVSSMVGISRIVWTLRTRYSVHTNLIPNQFCALILQEIEEAEQAIPHAREELQRIESAARALKQIFA